MEDFIQDATTQLEVPKQAAQRAARYILQFVQIQIGESDFEQLLQKLPGASELLRLSDDDNFADNIPTGEQGENPFVGDALTDALTLANQMNAAGIESEHLAPFGKLFLEHAHQLVGEEWIEKIFDRAPNLRALMG